MRQHFTYTRHTIMPDSHNLWRCKSCHFKAVTVWLKYGDICLNVVFIAAIAIYKSKQLQNGNKMTLLMQSGNLLPF